MGVVTLSAPPIAVSSRARATTDQLVWKCSPLGKNLLNKLLWRAREKEKERGVVVWKDGSPFDHSFWLQVVQLLARHNISIVMTCCAIRFLILEARELGEALPSESVTYSIVYRTVYRHWQTVCMCGVCVCLSVCLSVCCRNMHSPVQQPWWFEGVQSGHQTRWRLLEVGIILLSDLHTSRVQQQGMGTTSCGYCAGPCVLYMCLVCCFPASWGEVSHSLVASKHHWNWWSLSEVSWAWKHPHLRSLVAIICNIILSAYLSEQGSLSKTHYSRPSHIRPSDIWNTQLSGSLYHYSN